MCYHDKKTGGLMSSDIISPEQWKATEYGLYNTRLKIKYLIFPSKHQIVFCNLFDKGPKFEVQHFVDLETPKMDYYSKSS